MPVLYEGVESTTSLNQWMRDDAKQITSYVNLNTSCWYLVGFLISSFFFKNSPNAAIDSALNTVCESRTNQWNTSSVPQLWGLPILTVCLVHAIWCLQEETILLSICVVRKERYMRNEGITLLPGTHHPPFLYIFDNLSKEWSLMALCSKPNY